jgi:hypothetical protein
VLNGSLGRIGKVESRYASNLPEAKKMPVKGASSHVHSCLYIMQCMMLHMSQLHSLLNSTNRSQWYCAVAVTLLTHDLLDAAVSLRVGDINFTLHHTHPFWILLYGVLAVSVL